VSAQERIGIGTANPQAQFHTTGDVMFTGVANDDNVTRLVVQNPNGLLAWRGAGSLSNYYWSLNGNANTTADKFLGTSDNAILKIKTSNLDRLIVYSSSTISSAIDVPAVEIISPAANLGFDGPGLKIYRNANVNNWAAAMDFAMNNSAGQKITFARLNGGIESNLAGNENGFMCFEVASDGQLGNLQQQEKMRILSSGNIGIGTKTPTAQLHTTSTVRFENLPPGTGFNLVIDADGNVFKAAAPPPPGRISTSNEDIINLRNEVVELKAQVDALKLLLKK